MSDNHYTEGSEKENLLQQSKDEGPPLAKSRNSNFNRMVSGDSVRSKFSGGKFRLNSSVKIRRRISCISPKLTPVRLSSISPFSGKQRVPRCDPYEIRCPANLDISCSATKLSKIEPASTPSPIKMSFQRSPKSKSPETICHADTRTRESAENIINLLASDKELFGFLLQSEPVNRKLGRNETSADDIHRAFKRILLQVRQSVLSVQYRSVPLSRDFCRGEPISATRRYRPVVARPSWSRLTAASTPSSRSSAAPPQMNSACASSSLHPRLRISSSACALSPLGRA